MPHRKACPEPPIRERNTPVLRLRQMACTRVDAGRTRRTGAQKTTNSHGRQGTKNGVDVRSAGSKANLSYLHGGEVLSPLSLGARATATVRQRKRCSSNDRVACGRHMHRDVEVSAKLTTPAAVVAVTVSCLTRPTGHSSANSPGRIGGRKSGLHPFSHVTWHRLAQLQIK
jgi:hypothetical protein